MRRSNSSLVLHSLGYNFLTTRTTYLRLCTKDRFELGDKGIDGLLLQLLRLLGMTWNVWLCLSLTCSQSNSKLPRVWTESIHCRKQISSWNFKYSTDVPKKYPIVTGHIYSDRDCLDDWSIQIQMTPGIWYGQSLNMSASDFRATQNLLLEFYAAPFSDLSRCNATKSAS